MKIWENYPILFVICLGVVSVFLVVYAVYLGLGAWFIIDVFKDSILPAILQRNQEMEEALELLQGG